MTHAETITHGPYELVVGLADGRMVIRRKDKERGRTRRRTVAFVETLAQWDRFVAALKAGDDEVAAVHAIDA